MSFLLNNIAGMCLSAGVVLNIVKTIGFFALLVVIIVAVLAVCIMFVPVKYDAKGDLDAMSIDAKLHWFFKIIMLRFSYKEETMDYGLYLFGIRTKLLDADAMEKRRKKREKRKAKKARKKHEKRKQKYQKEHNKYKEQFLKETTSEELNQDETISAKTSGDIIDGKISSKHEGKAAVHDSKAAENESGKRKLLDIIKKVLHIVQVVRQYQPVRLIWSDLQIFLHHARPRKLKGDIRFGFEDPSVTGKILGAISNLYFIYQFEELHINGDFETEETYINGDIDIKGHMQVIFAVMFAIRLIKQKQFRKFLKALKL